MLDLLDTHKHFLMPHLKRGCTAVDFTMGNGHDTLFLSRAVGENGKVYAFDIQQAALDSTEKLLKEHNAPENYTLICDSHHKVKDYVDGKIRVGMFNLGFLPGGDKSITTLHETTIPAIQAAIELLERDGCLIIAVYPGHDEGTVEGKMVEELLATYDRSRILTAKFSIVNSPESPFFFVVEKG